MNRDDYITLIKASDALSGMNELLLRLTGNACDAGEYYQITGIYDVLQNHAKDCYRHGDDGTDDFYNTLFNREVSVERRAEILQEKDIKNK